MFFSYLQDIQCVLLLDFHHGSSELDSLVEILENLFFDTFHVLFFIDSATNAAATICIYCVFRAAMSTLNSWQFVFVFDEILSELERGAFFAEFEFELFDFSVKIINDIFVFADMERHQFFICYRLSFNIFCSICIF